jgi:hypothetical protein
MSQNDLILINQLLEQRREEVAPDLSEPDYFEIFSAEQALKDYDLSYEEIKNGIVDGGGDGGIDSLFFFINENLFRDDLDIGVLKRNAELHIVFIQSKIGEGFSETGMERFISSARDLLDLNKPIDSLTTVYKHDLLDKISEFRTTYLGLIGKFPNLTISYYYVNKTTELHPNVERKVDFLKDVVESFFTPVAFRFEFLGASKLLYLARKSPSVAHQLRLVENPISTGQQGFVCLVALRDFFNFICDENGKLKNNIFEGNVRDYQGKTEVNQQIRETLEKPAKEDFWWLNNGISVICSKATLSGKVLTVENHEIVNGLQTSREIYNALSERKEQAETRNILARIIVPEEDSSRDRIIKATNSQTAIPSASLRATDKIHRDIEEYLATRGLYYDRRKNYYKNQGKPIKSIIGIAFLAQSVLACALLDPANARARPSSLLKDDNAYEKIFNTSYPLDLYFKCASLTKIVEDYLKSDACPVDKSHANNLLFYVAMLVALKITNLPRPSVKNISNIDIKVISPELILECVNDVNTIYASLGGTDKVAKGGELAKSILEAHEKKALEVLKAKNKLST